ncbi:hypothetical protein [Saccharothrix luteola]|uniref:hypothetical protein n=1 Tax=Saccharothrix luteola TaxID=2893018 RepID=UPI001E62887B|nr:hypothetical protein [Saccharothrix luteola]MCC8247377.1 hypothetical protein [Saccharothrix luteola]
MPTAGTGPRVRRLAHPDADIRARALGLPRGRPVLAVFGSADALSTELAAEVLPVLRVVLAAAARADAVVVTAGADVGVTHLVGLAAESLDGRWPRLVGVAPSGRVAAEDAEPADGEVRLNVNHDTAVLVPGSKWGEELPALFRAVDAVTGSKRPALALLIGGGEVARAALVDHLSRDRPLLVLAGTGGLADEIAGGRPRNTPATPASGTTATAPAGAASATPDPSALAATPAPSAHGAIAGGEPQPGAGGGTAQADAEVARVTGAADKVTAAGIAGVKGATAEVAALETGSAKGAVAPFPAASVPTVSAPTAPAPTPVASPPQPSAAERDDDLAVLVRSGQVAVVHLDEGADKVAAVVRRVLGNRPGAKLHADVPPPAVWPRVPFRAPEPHPVIDPGYVLDYPLLADAIHEANQVVAPVLHECEVAALRSRERARLLVVLAIAAGFGATVSAALQVWLRDEPWPGVLLAVSGAAAAVLAVVARSGEDPDAKVRAEQLRALYFDHLAAPPTVDDAERAERARELATAVARLRHESVSRT